MTHEQFCSGKDKHNLFRMCVRETELSERVRT